MSKEYLEQSIATFHLIFTLIACEFWKKLEPEDESRSYYLMVIAEKYGLQNRFDVTRVAHDFILKDKVVRVTTKTLSQLSIWFSYKKTGNFHLIKDDVYKADYSDKHITYQLMLASIKDDKELFYKLLKIALEKNEITPDELNKGLIYEDMKGSELDIILQSLEAKTN